MEETSTREKRPSSGGTNYILRFVGGKYEGREVPLRPGDDVVIGRSGDLDVVLVEDMVSRKHARVTYLQGGVVVQDLGSTNGTFVNGERVKRARLRLGDRILLGRSIIRLEELSPKATEAETRADRPMTPLRTAIPQPRPKPSGVSGSMKEVQLPDVMQLLVTGRKTGVLYVTSAQRGRVYLREGKIYYATIDDRPGMLPLKCFNRIISWEDGSFELRQHEEEAFPDEMQDDPAALISDAVQGLVELRQLAAELPNPNAELALANPLAPPLRALTPEQLDVIQAIHNYGKVETVLERSRLTDLETYKAILFLVRTDYVRLT